MAMGVAVSLLAGGPEVASAKETHSFLIRLLQDYALYDQDCRGGSSSAPETFSACGARDYAGYMAGVIFVYCFGKKGDATYQMEWHHCDIGSNLPKKPSYPVE